MAMDIMLPLYASFHYRSSESVGGFLSLKLSRHSLKSCTRRTPSSLVCALSSRDKSRRGPGQGQHTHSSGLSKYREERKKPFRLRGRLRLAVRHLRRLSPSLVLHDWVTYARAHSKQVALSILFGCTVAMGCLCLKLQSLPAPQFVPYSELVTSIHSGSVSSVLFEEGSRKVFFNVKPTDDEDVRNPLQTELSASKADLASPTLPETLTAANDGTEQDSSSRRASSPSAAAATFYSTLKAIGGALKPPLKTHSHPWKFATWRIEHDEAYLMSLMRTMEVTYSSTPQPMSMALRSTLIAIISIWIPLIPLFWLMRRQFSGGGSSSKKWQVNSESVKFEDVAGVDDVKVELMEIVSYHRGATNYRRLGAKLPKGVLLVGPPGTGKTLLARAVAAEAGVPFFAASASEFVEMFVGRGAARIRELFNGARKCSPSIIFIDELDAVGGRRGRSFNDERDQTLNQLLTEMDGFESKRGVLVIAATNRPEALDPALCRPGRFSRKVFVKEPDLKGREQILAVHMRGVPIEGDVQVVQSTLAFMTGGFVGADLANVVNEAALLAGREGRSVVTLEDFKTAIMRVKFGVGNRPAFSGALARVTNWLQPKTPAGYEAPSYG